MGSAHHVQSRHISTSFKYGSEIACRRREGDIRSSSPPLSRFPLSSAFVAVYRRKTGSGHSASNGSLDFVAIAALVAVGNDDEGLDEVIAVEKNKGNGCFADEKGATVVVEAPIGIKGKGLRCRRQLCAEIIPSERRASDSGWQASYLQECGGCGVIVCCIREAVTSPYKHCCQILRLVRWSWICKRFFSSTRIFLLNLLQHLWIEARVRLLCELMK